MWLRGGGEPTLRRDRGVHEKHLLGLAGTRARVSNRRTDRTLARAGLEEAGFLQVILAAG
jgi:hypothetical protein